MQELQLRRSLLIKAVVVDDLVHRLVVEREDVNLALVEATEPEAAVVRFHALFVHTDIVIATNRLANLDVRVTSEVLVHETAASNRGQGDGRKHRVDLFDKQQEPGQMVQNEEQLKLLEAKLE